MRSKTHFFDGSGIFNHVLTHQIVEFGNISTTDCVVKKKLCSGTSRLKVLSVCCGFGTKKICYNIYIFRSNLKGKVQNQIKTCS